MKETRFTPINLLIFMMAFVGFAPASFAQTEAPSPAAEKSMEGPMKIIWPKSAARRLHKKNI